MNEILKTLRGNRREYQDIIMKETTSFVYRDERYANHFSIILIYIKHESFNYKFQDIIRASDQYIQITTHLHCIILDSISSFSYIKGAEDILYKLQKEHLNNFYVSTVYSGSYSMGGLQIFNELFDILQCSIRHNSYNIVADIEYMKEFEVLGC